MKKMKAMILRKLALLADQPEPLEMQEVPVPEPGPGEVLIQVHACAVCHTELDEIEGRTPPPVLPVIPGHQVVGTVVARGSSGGPVRTGDRVGVAWIYSACGKCRFCKSGNENLCEDFRATGRDVNGGYAEYMVAKEDFVFPIPGIFPDSEAAPLLCAGAIGYRSLRLAGLKPGQILGLTGFGASGHLVMKMAEYLVPGTRVMVFARQPAEREFALTLGAAWAGDTGDTPPAAPDAIIDTTPAWKPVVEAMRVLSPGGRLVINAIRKEDVDKEELLRLRYPVHLWMEKEIKSVANVERRDVSEFLDLASRIPIRPEVEEYALEEANRALNEIKQRKILGAKVLVNRH